MKSLLDETRRANSKIECQKGVIVNVDEKAYNQLYPFFFNENKLYQTYPMFRVSDCNNS